MFRTKKDVDRHVQDVFRKLKDENEVRLSSMEVRQSHVYNSRNDYPRCRPSLSPFCHRIIPFSIPKLYQIFFSLFWTRARYLETSKQSIYLTCYFFALTLTRFFRGKNDDQTLKKGEMSSLICYPEAGYLLQFFDFQIKGNWLTISFAKYTF